MTKAALCAFRAMHGRTGNLPPLPGLYPDCFAPIVRNGSDCVRELAIARWGLNAPPSANRGMPRFGERYLLPFDYQPARLMAEACRDEPAN